MRNVVAQGRSLFDLISPSAPEGPRGDTLATLKDHLLAFVLAPGSNQSASLVESKEFRDLILYCRPELNEEDLPDRSAFSASIMDAWQKHLVVLKEDMARSLGQISYTADVWLSDDDTEQPYLTVTAHWISEELAFGLKSRSALIAYGPISRDYTGLSLAESIMQIMDRVGMAAKTGHITMVDNAENNKNCMQELANLLHARGVNFDPLERGIISIPHVVHGCATRVLESFTDPDITHIAEAWLTAFPDDQQREAYAKAMKRDPVVMGHDFVYEIRESGRCDVELFLDVEGWWDTTYSMISRLRASRQTIDQILVFPDQQDPENDVLGEWEWSVLEDLERILEIPYKVQQYVSKEALPRLGYVIPVFELFVNAWEKLGDDHPRVKPFTDLGLKLAQTHSAQRQKTRTHIIAMLVDPAAWMFWIRMNWDGYHLEAVQAVLSLMQQYHDRLQQTNQQNQRPPDRLTLSSLAEEFGIEYTEMSPASEQIVKMEYEAYVDDRVLVKGDDPIKFWEEHRYRFPTLFAIAMDYLPIQATAASSEHVFSTSTHLDIKKGSRPNHAVTEAQQMLKYNFRNENLNFTSWMLTDQDELLDEDD